MTVSAVARKARNFVAWPWFEKALLLPAWLLLGASRFVILALPFRYLAPRLGTRAGVSSWIPLLGPHQEARALSIGRVVRRAAAHTPWESTCLPRAVSARILLGICGIPYSLFFGVARNSERDGAGAKIDAHAWVAAGSVPVTGGVSFDAFTIVGCFVDPQSVTDKQRAVLRTR
jgi:hypothetical protein